jgi:acylphosphatase
MSGDGTVRRRVVVTGRVQGVCFRDGARRAARDRGVAGWVTNRGDGAVEAVFEGPSADVDALVAWMRDGPAHARVEAVHVSHEPPQGEDGFRVR